MSSEAQAIRAELPGVRTIAHEPGHGLPLFIMPVAEGLDSDAAQATTWFHEHRELIDALMTQVGALVFRGFAWSNATEFHELVQPYPEPKYKYVAGGTPRANVEGRSYEATRAPADVKLGLHQEMAYLPAFPYRLAFFCRKKAPAGGETIIGDMRRFTKRLDPALLKVIEERGVRYIRNFRSPDWASGDAAVDTLYYRPWDQAFGTSDRAEVERACREMELEFEWLDNGFLATSYVTAGVQTHPDTGELIWFNQIAPQALIPENVGDVVFARLEKALAGQVRPLATEYGDGTPIAMDDLRSLYPLYDEVTVVFPWLDGDVMFVDNLNVAHGRNPFQGTGRDVQVALLGREA